MVLECPNCGSPVGEEACAGCQREIPQYQCSRCKKWMDNPKWKHYTPQPIIRAEEAQSSSDLPLGPTSREESMMEAQSHSVDIKEHETAVTGSS